MDQNMALSVMSLMVKDLVTTAAGSTTCDEGLIQWTTVARIRVLVKHSFWRLTSFHIIPYLNTPGLKTGSDPSGPGVG
ncbi:hypothetical protein VP1G_11013 [Cytospora mali]|uniref:Uncharacterized protein n=1 Tax=Cytospora mali TaxID=578113 RepID=A0A194V2B2_CYTMA|nr:hypothetical protein VP1G_11013 [Valsa mali var. pyri (nom. inval.)]